jgi:hypothetical protein
MLFRAQEMKKENKRPGKNTWEARNPPKNKGKLEYKKKYEQATANLFLPRLGIPTGNNNTLSNASQRKKL